MDTCGLERVERFRINLDENNGSDEFPNDYEVKALSPHHRLLIALHSPEGVAETGLRVCSPEKKVAKLTYGVQWGTFSGTF
jgi:hypothetical protein